MILEEQKNNISSTGILKSAPYTLANPKHIFKLLRSNIYTDKLRAVIREISTNALDAHISSNVSRNFDVYLPTPLSPEFRVRDYGSGLSEEDMFTLYTGYGESTKRNTNTLVGSFGLGNKSPWAYTNIFYVISYFNGTKTTYTAYLDENDDSILSKLYSEPSEETGIEVKLNIKESDLSTFYNSAYEVYKYFDNVTFHNDSKLEEKIKDFKSKLPYLSDTLSNGTIFKLYSNRDTRGIKIIMGNIEYPLNTTQVPTDFSMSDLELYVPLGSVSMSPSRESLEYSSKTIIYLKDTLDTFNKYIQSHIEKAITPDMSLYTALYTWHRLLSTLPYGIQSKLKFNFKKDPKAGNSINLVGFLASTSGKGVTCFTINNNTASKKATYFPVSNYLSVSSRHVLLENDVPYEKRSGYIRSLVGKFDYNSVFILASKDFLELPEIKGAEYFKLSSFGITKPFVKSSKNHTSSTPISSKNKILKYNGNGTYRNSSSWWVEEDLDPNKTYYYYLIDRYDIPNGYGNYTDAPYFSSFSKNLLKFLNLPDTTSIYGIKKNTASQFKDIKNIINIETLISLRLNNLSFDEKVIFSACNNNYKSNVYLKIDELKSLFSRESNLLNHSYIELYNIISTLCSMGYHLSGDRRDFFEKELIDAKKNYVPRSGISTLVDFLFKDLGIIDDIIQAKYFRILESNSVFEYLKYIDETKYELGKIKNV